MRDEKLNGNEFTFFLKNSYTQKEREGILLLIKLLFLFNLWDMRLLPWIQSSDIYQYDTSKLGCWNKVINSSNKKFQINVIIIYINLYTLLNIYSNSWAFPLSFLGDFLSSSFGINEVLCEFALYHPKMYYSICQKWSIKNDLSIEESKWCLVWIHLIQFLCFNLEFLVTTSMTLSWVLIEIYMWI